MKKESLTITAKSFVDGAPIAMLVQLAGKFTSSIYFNLGTKHINAKSIMGMMSLALTAGSEIELTAEGPDEDSAVAEITQFLTK